MRYKKWFLSAALAAVLAVTLAVPSLALVPYDTPKDVGFTVEQGNTYIGTIKTSMLDADGKAFMRDWFDVSTGKKSSSYLYFSTFGRSGSNVFIEFYRVKGSLAMTSPTSMNVPSPLPSSGYIEYVLFSYVGGEYVYSLKSLNAPSFNTRFLSTLLTYCAGATPSSFHTQTPYLQCVGNFYFRDDDGLFSEPEPEPSSSSTPSEPEKPPFVEPGVPSLPSGDASSLGYDPAIWDALMWYLRDTIGVVGNVLFLIVALICIVPFLFSIVRHALKNGSKDGDGGGLI